MSEDDRKIFVGGLPTHATQDDVKAHFAQFGEIELCSLKTDQETGRSRGFAFIAFTTLDETNAALNYENHEIGGKHVDPKRAKPQNANPVNKVFVGGLDRQTTKEEVTDAFAHSGTVTDVFLPMDRETNEGKGYAFVTFTESSVASTLCNEGRIVIKGKECEVKRAKSKTESNRGGGFRGGGRGGGRGGYGGGGYESYGGGGGGGYGGGGYGGQSYGGSGGYGGGGGYSSGGSGGGYGGYGEQASWGGSYGGHDQYKMKGGRGGSSGYQPY